MHSEISYNGKKYNAGFELTYQIRNGNCIRGEIYVSLYMYILL